MADSVIEGFLGGEPEEPAAEARDLEPLAGADPLAAAIAVEAAEADSGSRSDAVAYLQAQKALVDLQVLHFEQELHLAHQQRLLAIGAARRKRFADRLKNA